MKNRAVRLPVLAGFLLCMAAGSQRAGAQLAVPLEPRTLQAFERYVRAVEREEQTRLGGQAGFLRSTGDPSLGKGLRAGNVPVRKLEHIKISIPGGLVHDWFGAVFVPGARAGRVVAAMQDFERQPGAYPEVLQARLLGREGNQVRSHLRLVKNKVVTVVLDTDHVAWYEPQGPGRMFVRSYSSRIQQVENHGRADERLLPEGRDGGFLWRLNAYWRLQEADGGVYVELRTISLTRDIPAGLAWLLRPFITSIPQESLRSTLEGTRAAALR
jgi:hypothetical protein